MSDLSMDKAPSISHDMIVHRTMFIKPIMSHNHTQSICGVEGVNQSVPTCHHCGITGHIRPNCFQIRSQKPWNKTLVPRKDEDPPPMTQYCPLLAPHTRLPRRSPILGLLSQRLA
jgi:hypothetical protein